jgi:hypothetical protein
MSFTSLDFSSITSEGYIVYNIDTGFKVLIETNDDISYFGTLTYRATCIMQGAYLTALSGSFADLANKDKALIKVDSSWATVVSFVDNNNVILDRTFDSARLCTFSGSTVTTVNDFAVGTRITFKSTGVLPTGIANNTVYYVKTVTPNTFTFSSTLGGAAVVTSGGSGLFSVYRVYDASTSDYYPDLIKDTIVAKVIKVGANYTIEPYYTVNSELDTVTPVATRPATGEFIGQVILDLSDSTIYTWDGTFWIASSTEVIRSATPPSSPTSGQFWFRTTDSLLFSWNGTEWVQVVSATPGNRYINVTTESGLYTGELVTNTVDNNLYRWDGSVWVLVSDTSILDLSNDSHTVPTDFNNTSPDLTGAETIVRVFSGGADVTNLWTLSATPDGVTGSFGVGANSNKYTIATITQDAAYVDFTATRGSYSRTARFSVALARGGEDGTPVTVHRVIPSVYAIKELSGAFTPSTITFQSYVVSTGFVLDNSDFKIYTSTNGTSFTEISYLADRTDVNSYVLTVPNTNFIKVEIYAPGTANLRDVEIIPIISDGTDGNSGSTAIRLDLSNENATILADVNGTNINLSDAVTTVRVYEGISEAAGWTITTSLSAGVTVSNVGNVYTVTGFTGTTGYVEFTATKSGFSNLVARFNLTKITSGNIYRIKPSVDSVVKNALGAYVPTTVTFSAEKVDVTGTAAYAGRFIIATSTDGTSFTTAYTSGTNESSVNFSVPANITHIKGNLYLAGGVSTLLDFETIPIVSNGTSGSNGVDSRAVSVQSTTQVFSYLAAGTTPSPGSATVSAQAFNTSGATQFWFYKNNVYATQGTYAYTPQASFSSMPDLVRVDLYEGGTKVASDSITLYGVRNAGDAISVILSNEAHTVTADTSGNVTSYSGSGTTIRVFEGTTELSYDGVGTANGTWRITEVSPNINPGTITDSGAFVTIGDHNSMTADIATIDFTVIGKRLDGTAISITKTQTITKSRAGATGLQGPGGSNGVQGPTGTTGSQARIAYAIGTSNFAFSGTQTLTPAGDVLPSTGNWGLTTTWAYNTQPVTVSGTSLYQVTGLYNPATNITTWYGYPYLSALKVGSLSAITATIGTLRTAESGARTEIKDNLIEVYDASGQLRVRLGVWT